ncbi:MAG: lyase family protein [Gemmatimonadaceae bacterium]
MSATRTEKDPLGTLDVPAEALYGVQSAPRRPEFSDQWAPALEPFVIAQVWIKKAAALTHRETFDARLADAIVTAADEVLGGQHREHFVVDPYQAGAGTSHNMNTNEVLANCANELLGGRRGEYKPVHPNDHVNMAQSTNDTIPTNIRLSTLSQVASLVSAFESLRDALADKGREFDDIVKAGRTHLQDAMPIRPAGVRGVRGFDRPWNSPRSRGRRVPEGPGHCGSAVGTGVTVEAAYPVLDEQAPRPNHRPRRARG